MALNLANSFKNLTPKQKQMGLIGGAVAVLAILLIGFTDSSEPQKKVRWNPKTDKTVSVITDQNTKNLGLEAMAGRIKMLDRSNKLLLDQVNRLERERAAEKADASQERVWREKFDALSNEINALKAQQRDTQTRIEQVRGGAGVQTGDEDRIDDPFKIREQKRRQLAGGDEEELELLSGKKGGKPATGQSTARSGVSISMVSEEPDEEEKPADTKKKKRDKTKVFIPAGSILTGTLITGADFPTGKGSMDNPTPSLIRVSKHAILPNRFSADVRECFLLVSGHGELSSERAKLRGEMLSCVRNDGGVIQTKLNSYVAGEDGKEGIKGRLVSKQGQLIARTLVAGFLSGMSEAFDYDQVSVISTTASNRVQYQKNWSSEAGKGGLAKGAQNALEKVADFYMQLADEMVPVVEINAGRQVDLVVISGTTLDVRYDTVSTGDDEEENENDRASGQTNKKADKGTKK